MTGPIYSEWSKNGVGAGGIHRVIFATVAKYFDAHPGFTRVASNFGVGGSGFGFDWMSNPVHGGAFGVWRNISSSLQSGLSGEPTGIPAHDIVFVLGDSLALTDATSSWTPSSFGVWYTVAWHSSSVAWNGTTANNGQDNWSTTPWKPSSIVLCRTNGSGATCSSSLNALSRLDYGGTGAPEIVITGDNDTTTVAFRSMEGGPNSLFNKIAIFGGYQRLTASFNVPLFNVGWQPAGALARPWTELGTTSPNAFDCGIATKSSVGVKKIGVDYPAGFIEETSGIGASLGGYSYYTVDATPDTVHNYIIEWPITVGALEWNNGIDYDNFVGSYFLLGGYIPNIRIAGTNGVIARFYNQNNRVALGWSSNNGSGDYDIVITLPWNSSSLQYRNY